MTSACPLEIEKLERPNAPFIFVSAPADFKKRLTLSRGELVEMITRELNDRVRQLLVCPTADIFIQERAKVFGEYSLLLKAVSKIILTDTDAMVHQTLVQGAICNYEATVRRASDDLFGRDITEEILFSLSTLRRAYRLIGQILTKECPENSLAEDGIHAKEFAAAVSWTGIHLDCILSALRETDVPHALPLDVLQEMLKGSRLSVTAYAHARAGYDLRYSKDEAPNLFGRVEWDEEDRFLADQSTSERESLIQE